MWSPDETGCEPIEDIEICDECGAAYDPDLRGYCPHCHDAAFG